MKKIDEERIFELAKAVEKSNEEAETVNVGVLPNDDIHKLVHHQHNVNELINYILGLDEKEKE